MFKQIKKTFEHVDKTIYNYLYYFFELFKQVKV